MEPKTADPTSATDSPQTSDVSPPSDPLTSDAESQATVPDPPATDPTDSVDPGLTTDEQAAQTQQTSGDAVPEQRPQAFIAPVGGISEASKRLDNAKPATQEDIDRANSDEAKAASVENSQTPRYYEGQRVTFVSGPEKGRMAFVRSVNYSDSIQAMVAASGLPEARYADVAEYIVQTRDGRSDILVATPDQIKPLDDIEGWGRGQI